MKSSRDKICQFILSSPRKTLFLNCLALLFFLPGFTMLKTDFSYRAWYSEDDFLLKEYDRFERTFGNDESLIIGLYHPNGVLNQSSLKKIHHISEDLWKIKKIMRVDSLLNYDLIQSSENDIEISPLVNVDNLESFDKNRLLQNIAGQKFVENYLLSKDQKLTVIRAKLRPLLGKNINNEDVVISIEKMLGKYQDSEHEMFVSGNGTFLKILKDITFRDMVILIPLVSILFALVLFAIFRSFKVLFLTIMTIFTAMIVMFGCAGYLEQPLNSISSASPVILLTVAIADAIHLITVYFYSRKQGYEHKVALAYSLKKNFYPTLLTSLTTAIGFFSFSGSMIQSLSHMGIQIGIGVLAAWICSYGILAPLMLLFLKKITNLHKTSTYPWLQRMIPSLVKKTNIIVVASLLIFVLSALGLRQLEINLNPHDQFPKTHSFIKSIDMMTKHFGTVAQAEIMLKHPNVKEVDFLKKVEALENWLLEKEYIQSTLSVNDIIKDINRTFTGEAVIPQSTDEVAQSLLFYTLGLPPGRDINNRISVQNDAIRITINWTLVKTKEVLDDLEIIKSKAVELGLNCIVTGKTPLFHRITPYVVSSFIESFAIALVAISLLLMFVLRSFKLGLLALIPNLYPLMLGAGAFALSGAYIDVATVLVASVCLSIAVDDSIHFLIEFRKQGEKGAEIEENLRDIFSNTAPSLINTTLIISIGFAVLFVADYQPNAKFGLLTSITLLIALLADLIILPAILVKLQKKP